MASTSATPTKVKFTNRAVSALKPKDGKQARYWDTDVSGLFVRVQPTGRITFAISYRHNGKRNELTIGTYGKGWTVEKAKIRAREVINTSAMGQNPIEDTEDEQTALKVSELVDLYLSEGPIDRPDKRASSWANDKSYLDNHVRPLLGKKPIEDLKPALLSKWQNDVLIGKSAREKQNGKKGRAVKGGPGAAAHATRSFSACLGWAVEREFLSNNPFDRIRKAQDGRRERYLSTEEAKKLFKAISDLLKESRISEQMVDAIEILFYSAARVSEVLGLRWSEVDFERKILILPPLRHKTGKKSQPKVLPLTKPTLRVLKKRRKQIAPSSEFVFPSDESKSGRLSTVRHAWAAIVERAGVSDFRIHDFRHAYASFAINKGMSLKIIGANLGHKKAATTERYAHLLVDARRPVAEGVSDFYDSLR